jgi:anti-anti-sigma factor
MGAELEFRSQELKGCVISRLAGEVDMTRAGDLEGHLCSVVEQGHVVVDLSRVTFLDSTALGAMIVAYRRANVLGHSVRLAGATGPVRTMLETTRLSAVLEHHDDVGDAVEAALTDYHEAPR